MPVPTKQEAEAIVKEAYTQIKRFLPRLIAAEVEPSPESLVSSAQLMAASIRLEEAYDEDAVYDAEQVLGKDDPLIKAYENLSKGYTQLKDDFVNQIKASFVHLIASSSDLVKSAPTSDDVNQVKGAIDRMLKATDEVLQSAIPDENAKVENIIVMMSESAAQMEQFSGLCAEALKHIQQREAPQKVKEATARLAAALPLVVDEIEPDGNVASLLSGVETFSRVTVVMSRYDEDAVFDYTELLGKDDKSVKKFEQIHESLSQASSSYSESLSTAAKFIVNQEIARLADAHSADAVDAARGKIQEILASIQHIFIIAEIPELQDVTTEGVKKMLSLDDVLPAFEQACEAAMERSHSPARVSNLSMFQKEQTKDANAQDKDLGKGAGAAPK